MKQLIVDSNTAKQMLVDYLNASNEVFRYAASVMAINLPALVEPPPNYGDYANTLAQAKIDASVWTTDVAGDFNVIPNAFINFNSLIQAQLNIILTELNALKSDPGDQSAIDNIKAAINALLPEISSIQKTISGLDSEIVSYQNSIQPDADALNTLSKEIAAAENADEAAIAQMNDAFNDLQTLVDDRNKMVTLNTLANFDLSFFLAVVGVAVGAPFSGVAALIVGGVVGIGSAAFTTFVPIPSTPDFEQSLQEIQTEMSNINSEIGLMNSTIGLLQQTSSTFVSVVNNSSDAEKMIKIISAFWQNQENDINELVNDIDEILANTGNPADIDQSISEIEDAQASWNDVESFMQQIQNVTYTVTQINTDPQRS